jgi:NAD(P)-dependent dehydrogenase (short-subunit alcohol dehydrogenase family)
MRNKFDLSGKVALITGAAGLLGREHARALLESGAKVVLTDIRKDCLEVERVELGSCHGMDNILAYPMDVTSESSILSVLDGLHKKDLDVSILINNAAIDPKVVRDSSLGETSRLENFSLSQWNLELSVGLTGAFLCAKIFGSAMANKQQGGVILNIASDLSVISPDQRLYRKQGVAEIDQPVKPITYSVIKAGLVGMTRYLSTYWPDKGIRCNALSPGGVENSQGEEFMEKLTSLIPLGRMAAADEYHSAVQFLCSDASVYLTGQNIVIDGGRSVW